jgi:hypothetical protein
MFNYHTFYMQLIIEGLLIITFPALLHYRTKYNSCRFGSINANKTSDAKV